MNTCAHVEQFGAGLLLFLACIFPRAAGAQPKQSQANAPGLDSAESRQRFGPQAPPEEPQKQPSAPKWHYGGFADLGYLLDFNHPSNHLFRNRSTTFRVNEVDLNMAGAYVKKDASERSRWGAELTLQAGRDSEGFGFSPSAPNVG